MRRKLLLLIGIAISLLFQSCSESTDFSDIANYTETRSNESDVRLQFDSKEELNDMIMSGSSDAPQTFGLPEPIYGDGNFRSLLSPMPNSEEGLTYYEALGYDSLVPNVNFAKLLNIHGELEVKDSIVKITPDGTFIVPKALESEFRQFMSYSEKGNGKIPADKFPQINPKIRYIRTFNTNPDDYTLISSGNYEELPDDYFDSEDGNNNSNPTRASVQEPNFNSFTTFSANHSSIVGKLIQNLIGSTKEHTINFNNKRRVKGSFYWCNYGVYGETGIKGWTDKKNWIGWSKVESDELRVGWRNVIIDIPTTSDLKKAIEDNKDIGYLMPQNIYINSGVMYTACLIMPEPKKEENFWNKIKKDGVSYIKQYVKQNYHNASNIENAQAFIIITPGKIKFLAADGDIIKYGEKSYCHVFTKDYMEIKGGFNNTTGWFINDTPLSSLNSLQGWFNLAKNIVMRKFSTLENGEAYVCARLGNDWRGMKIER